MQRYTLDIAIKTGVNQYSYKTIAKSDNVQMLKNLLVVEEKLGKHGFIVDLLKGEQHVS